MALVEPGPINTPPARRPQASARYTASFRPGSSTALSADSTGCRADAHLRTAGHGTTENAGGSGVNGASRTAIRTCLSCLCAGVECMRAAADAAALSSWWLVSASLVGDADVLAESVFRVDAGLLCKVLGACGASEESRQGQGVRELAVGG